MPRPFGSTFDGNPTEDGVEAELLDPIGSSGPAVESGRVETGPSRWLIAAVSVVAVVAGISLLARAEPDPVGEAAQRTTVPAGELRTQETAAERAAAVAALRRSDAAPPVAGLRLVATNYVGNPPLRVVTDSDGVEIDELPLVDLFEFEVDSGGRLLAALSQSELREENSVLWVGAVDGDLDPLAVDVRGYSWHDTRPGRLAFIAEVPGRPGLTLFTLDLGEPDAKPVAVAEADGWLRMWGDWGFVVGVIGFGGLVSSFDTLGPDGAPAADRRRGSPAGYVAGIGLVYSPWGDRGQPVALDPATGEIEPVPALVDTHYVWTVRSGGSGDLTAIQATNLETRKHSIIVVDGSGSVVAELPAVGAPAAMIWTDGGRTLAYVLEDHETATMLVLYDAAGDESAQLTLDFLDPAEHWTRAISLR